VMSRIGITRLNSINDWLRLLPTQTRFRPDRILAHICELAMDFATCQAAPSSAGSLVIEEPAGDENFKNTAWEPS
jgi:hypothetical protein